MICVLPKDGIGRESVNGRRASGYSFEWSFIFGGTVVHVGYIAIR